MGGQTIGGQPSAVGGTATAVLGGETAISAPGRLKRLASTQVPAGLATSIFVSLAVMVGLQIVGRAVIDRAAESNALEQSGELTARAADVALAPFLADELIAGDPTAVAAMDNAAWSLINDGEIRHIKIWSADGTIVWSDQPELRGQSFELASAERSLLATHGSHAEVSHLDDPENYAEAAAGVDRLLEVYFGTQTSSGAPLLVETYSSYELVATRANELRATFVPLLTVGLALLAIVQIGLVWVLGRRLSSSERRRNRLLERVLEASDAERKRVAAQVHDGVVQDLMGIGFSLSGIAKSADRDRRELRRLAGSTRSAVTSLRNLLSTIYPVEVPPEGWVAGLDDVIEALRSQGVAVQLDIDDSPLAPIEQLLLLRIAREALRNIANHAHARNAIVELVVRRHHLELKVSDDGTGFEPENTPDGHLGLRLMRDLAADSGGQLSIASQLHAGTTVTFELAHAS